MEIVLPYSLDAIPDGVHASNAGFMTEDPSLLSKAIHQYIFVTKGNSPVPKSLPASETHSLFRAAGADIRTYECWDCPPEIKEALYCDLFRPRTAFNIDYAVRDRFKGYCGLRWDPAAKEWYTTKEYCPRMMVGRIKDREHRAQVIKAATELHARFEAGYCGMIEGYDGGVTGATGAK